MAEDQPGEPAVGRQAELLAVGELLGRETLEIVAGGEADGGGVGLEALDDRAPRVRAAAGAARDLRDELEGPLGRAEVGEGEGGVGADHADEAHIREVEPLRDHLRAHQHLDLALSEALERVVEVRGRLHGVAVDAQQRLAFDQAREESRELFLDALRAEAEHRHGLAALGALLRQQRFGKAVVAAHEALARVARGVDMAHHACVAVGAGEHPLAARVAAGDVVRIAAAVEKKKHLPALAQRLLHRLAQRRADEVDAPVADFAAFCAKIDDRDLRDIEPGRALREAVERRDLALDRVHPALEARRRAAEDDRALRDLRAADRSVATVVAGRRVLLVAGLVLFVDHDQTE